MENEEMVEETLTPEETVDSEETTEEPEESIEDLKAKLAKAEEVAKNQKIRAEKAESAAKTAKVEEKKEELTSLDIIAITRANIADDDILEVTEYAKFKGISISDALKDDKLKAILKLNDEKRTVATAANVTTSKRASSKLSDESVLANAERGVFPDDPSQLAEARLRMKRSK